MTNIRGIRPRNIRLVATAAALAILSGSGIVVRPAEAASGSTTLGSPAMNGAFANAEARQPAISADGRYLVYSTAASNIGPGDANGLSDVYVHDRYTGASDLVSQSSGGQIGNGDSSQPSISPDGGYVAFASLATNFAPESNPVVNGAEVNARDVFLRDLRNSTTTRVTRGGGSLSGIGGSFDPSVSQDAAYVAFASLDRQVAGPGDCNDVHDVMVWERATGAVRMVPVGTTQSTCGTGESAYPGLGQANRASQSPSISADGRFIAYSSDGYNIDATRPDSHKYDLPQPPLSTDPVLGTNIFVWDRTTGMSSRIDNAAGGAEPNGDAGFVPAISRDGNHVAYMSSASDLVAGDVNGVRDTFRFNRTTGATQRVSQQAGANGDGQTCTTTSTTSCQSYEGPAISSDGRFVAFVSGATNLVQPDANATGRDVYVRDFADQSLSRVNVNDSGAQAAGSTVGSAPAISWDGRYVAYASNATNLVAGDVNGMADIFVSDAAPSTPPPFGGGAAATPTNVQATAQDGRATVSWTAPVGGPALNGYRVVADPAATEVWPRRPRPRPPSRDCRTARRTGSPCGPSPPRATRRLCRPTA